MTCRHAEDEKNEGTNTYFRLRYFASVELNLSTMDAVDGAVEASCSVPRPLSRALSMMLLVEMQACRVLTRLAQDLESTPEVRQHATKLSISSLQTSV